MTKFKKKYRVESARNKNWDYKSSGKYFVTINCYWMLHYFGMVKNKKMFLSETGKIAKRIWLEIPDHFNMARLDSFIIMPNHMHAIIEIVDHQTRRSLRDLHSFFIPYAIGESKIIPGMDCCFCYKAPRFKPYHSRYRNPGKGSVSTIIGSFKAAVTKESRIINPNFRWQARFHDRIIRNDHEYWRIKKYILDNPKQWGK